MSELKFDSSAPHSFEQQALEMFALKSLVKVEGLEAAQLIFPSPEMPDYAVKLILRYEGEGYRHHEFKTLQEAYDFIEALLPPKGQTMQFQSNHTTTRQTELAQKAKDTFGALHYNSLRLDFSEKPKSTLVATHEASDTTIHKQFSNYQQLEAWLDNVATLSEPSGKPDPWDEVPAPADPWDGEPLTPSQKAKKSPLEVAEANDQKGVENLKGQEQAEPDEAPANADWEDVPDGSDTTTGALDDSGISDAYLAYTAPSDDDDAMNLVHDVHNALNGLGPEPEVQLELYEHSTSARLTLTTPDGYKYVFMGTRQTLTNWLSTLTHSLTWAMHNIPPGHYPIPQGMGDLEAAAEQQATVNGPAQPISAEQLNEMAEEAKPQPAQQVETPQDFEPISDDDLFAEEDDPEALAQEKAEKASASFASASHQQQVAQMQARQQAQDSLHMIMSEIENLLDQEHRGEINKNESRWRKGEAVLRADAIAEDFKRAGDEERNSRAKVLRQVREEVSSRRSKRGVIDSVGRLTQNEIALTSKAYRAFIQGRGNDFDLVDQLDENGAPITNDVGDPPNMSVGEIALNKAYALADAATPETRDRLLSFAWRYDEATCKLMAKALKQHGGKKPASAVDPIFDGFYQQRLDVETEAGYHAEVQLDNNAARDYLRTLVPSAASEVRSIKIDKALYEGTWMNTLQHFSVLWQWLGNPVDENTGLMSNSQALERLLERVAPHENGFSGLVEMMVWSGEMTQAQASDFIEQHLDYSPEETPA